MVMSRGGIIRQAGRQAGRAQSTPPRSTSMQRLAPVSSPHAAIARSSIWTQVMSITETASASARSAVGVPAGVYMENRRREFLDRLINIAFFDPGATTAELVRSLGSRDRHRLSDGKARLRHEPYSRGLAKLQLSVNKYRTHIMLR